MRIEETCGCGAKVTVDEPGESGPTLAVTQWRREHACTAAPPGPCAHSAGVMWPTGEQPACELRAGHDGAHECSRGSMGGTAVWTDEPTDVEAERDQQRERAERAEAAEHDARADYDRRGERLWRLAAAAGWRPGNDADNDATAETHILERLREAERAETKRRDLTRRLGFGDNITEPQADNDTIVRWIDERLAEANEWVEHQRWRDQCYAAGHLDTEDCWEHDPSLRLERAEAELAALRERVRALVERATEAAYGAIADEQMLTILPTEHGAKVPPHWRAQAEARATLTVADLRHLLDDDTTGAASGEGDK